MNSRIIGLLCLAILCVPASAFAADWPQFRGPNADGISPETGINKAWKEKPPKELWRFALSDGGYAGPSAAGGKVFIIDHVGATDVVRALDIDTGEQVWEFSYSEPLKADYGFARSTPTVNDGKVYTLSFSGKLHCLNAGDGTRIWARDIVADFNGRPPQWKMAMSPVIDGDKLIVTPAGKDSAVVVLDKNTGKAIWQCGSAEKAGYATPVVATINGRKQYIVFHGTGLIGADAEKGEVLWTFPWTARYFVNAATPLAIGNFVFFSSNYQRGCALVRPGRGQAKKVWENKEMQSHFSSSVLYKGYIFGTGEPGFLMCLDPKTGKAMWKQKGFEKGGIVVVDGTIIALNGRNGDVVMAKLTPKGYHELGRIRPLGGQSWTAPIVADGKLLVRNKKALSCLDLK